MMERSNNGHTNAHPKQIPIWSLLYLSILFVALSVTFTTWNNYERRLVPYSPMNYIKTESTLSSSSSHRRRLHSTTTNKVRRRTHVTIQSDHNRPYILKGQKANKEHIQEILHFLNHV
jgi:hypothetical protein